MAKKLLTPLSGVGFGVAIEHGAGMTTTRIIQRSTAIGKFAGRRICKCVARLFPKHYVSGRSRSIDPDIISQFYYLNMNIVVGVSLGLIAARVYDTMDGTPSEIGWNFGLSTWITIQFLLVAYCEYYYFTQTIKTTNHPMDALSSLLLGAIQGFAIYCLRKNGSVSNWWWLCEAFYVSFGIIAFVHSWLHIPGSEMHHKGIISETITLSVVICVAMEVIIAIGGMASYFEVLWLTNLILVVMSLTALALTWKSFKYLAIWEKQNAQDAAAEQTALV